MTLDLQTSSFASKFRAQTSETETKDPASWFRPDADIWTPPPKDPDVWGPPKPEKYVLIKIHCGHFEDNGYALHSLLKLIH